MSHAKFISFTKTLILVVVAMCATERIASADDKSKSAKPLRAGMIGLDTSHVNAFTRVFNRKGAEGDLADIEIAVGFPAGTDVPMSRDRVGMFTKQLRERGMEIVDSIPALLEKVDVVLLESVDGRIHLEQAIPIFQAGKPVFIDKPLAGSLADAVAIAELVKKYNVPCFSSSMIRFSLAIQSLLDNEEVGEIAGALTWGPCSVQSDTPDLFFYGIHGIEGLFTLMGPGCVSVQRTHTNDTDMVTGTWTGGRVGSYRGIRHNKASFGATAFGEKGIVTVGRSDGYEPLCQAMAKFFKTGKSPVSLDETVEIFAFMEAAEESKRQCGKPVTLESVLAKARKEAKKRIEEFDR